MVSTNSMELFLQACGRAGPLRLSVEYQGRPLAMERVLHQPFAMVGCDPRMDLFLNHPQVSRRHAYLQLLGGKLFCIDLQSRSGIHWEGGSKRSGWLDFEQALRVGPFWIRVSGGGENGPASVGNFSALHSPGEEELPEVALEFVNRVPGPTVWRMATMLALVGKAPLCRVRLVGSSVSRFHCSLVRTPLGLWVVDLFGKGGVSVNEMPVRSARLEDGDRLQVGNFIIRPRYSRPVPSRIPYGDVTDSTGLMLGQAGDSVSWPAPRETFPEPGPDATQSAAASPALASPAVDRTEPPTEPPFPLIPVLPPTPQDPSAGRPEIMQSLLVPVTQQLGMMQQQMFDQFQQAMLMMFQMFGKLQREQIGVIRDEMDRLHQLSREVLALQTELAKHTQAAQERPPGAPPAPGPRGVPGSTPANSAPQAWAAPKQTAEAKPLPLPPGEPEKDMHAWLSQRIAAIQQERQTRWQKIVGYLTGKVNDRPAP